MVKYISGYQPVSPLLNFMNKPAETCEHGEPPVVASRVQRSRLSEFVAVMLELWNEVSVSIHFQMSVDRDVPSIEFKV
jgi:hypothetical protein